MSDRWQAKRDTDRSGLSAAEGGTISGRRPMSRGEDGTAVTHRVLYVAGTGRSGSTLLARILDRADGVFAAGEVRYMWQRGLVEDRLCGCGERFSECPFWRDVLERAFGARSSVDAQRV